MSQPNPFTPPATPPTSVSAQLSLNQAAPGQQAPERFDLQQHVHAQKPFVTGFWMLAAVVVVLCALAASLLGGIYLLVQGPAPEFAQLLHPGKDKGGDGGGGGGFWPGTSQPKPLDEATKETLASFTKEWNEGSFSGFWTTGDFTIEESDGKKSDGRVYRPGTKIVAQQVARITQLSDDLARADVGEMVRLKSTMSQWYAGGEKSSSQKPLAVERIDAYEYQLERDGARWRVSRRKWLKTMPGARIHQADDEEPDEAPGSSTPEMVDKRLKKEELQRRYEAMAQVLSQFTFPRSEVFDDYRLVLGDENGERTAAQMQERLSRAKARIDQMQVSAEVLSTKQLNDTRATADVRYRALFRLPNSKNEYVAVWKDHDTWATSANTGNWFLAKTERTYRSELMEHYER